MKREEQQYTDLNSEDREDAHDDSATEVSMSLLSEEGRNWKGGKQRSENQLKLGRIKRWSAVLFSAQGILNTVLLLVIVGLLVERRWHQEKIGLFEGNGDLTGFAPRFSQQIKTFVPDPMYAPENASDFFTLEVREKWLSLVPKGLGYLRLERPGDYNNLPTPLVGYEGTVFTTSMTHQLHCLHAIVETFADINDSRNVPNDMAWHLGHCFEYLRQSIMCCGDVALEGQQTTFPEGTVGSDGWDAKHVCKDYNQIYNYLEENRADDQSWI